MNGLKYVPFPYESARLTAERKYQPGERAQAEAEFILDQLDAAGGNYARGTVCTWHNFGREARMKSRMVDGQIKLVPTCPNCGCDVQEISFEAWIAQVRQVAQADPEVAAIVKWGRNRCFPDHETLVNAYRQAMEE